MVELIFVWGDKERIKRLHWTPETGALIRLYRPVRDSELDGLNSGVISEDGEWKQIATFTQAETKDLRAFFDAVDALR